MTDWLLTSFGGLTPYILVAIFGFLPSEIWRVAAVFVAKDLDEASEILIWVRLVATALLAGIVANIMTHPSGTLAAVPFGARIFSLAVAIALFFVSGRRVIPAVLSGLGALLLCGWWVG